MIIDMQRIFGEPISEWATPGYAGDRWDPAPARRIRVPHLLDTVRAARATDRCLDRLLPEVALCSRSRQRAANELSDEFAAIPATAVDRTTFGKREPRPTERSDTPSEIVLTGVTTDCCVLSTALAAADAGVHVIVAADACRGHRSGPPARPRCHDALQPIDRHRRG